MILVAWQRRHRVIYCARTHSFLPYDTGTASRSMSLRRRRYRSDPWRLKGVVIPTLSRFLGRIHDDESYIERNELDVDEII